MSYLRLRPLALKHHHLRVPLIAVICTTMGVGGGTSGSHHFRTPLPQHLLVCYHLTLSPLKTYQTIPLLSQPYYFLVHSSSPAAAPREPKPCLSEAHPHQYVCSQEWDTSMLQVSQPWSFPWLKVKAGAAMFSWTPSTLHPMLLTFTGNNYCPIHPGPLH